MSVLTIARLFARRGGASSRPSITPPLDAWSILVRRPGLGSRATLEPVRLRAYEQEVQEDRQEKGKKGKKASGSAAKEAKLDKMADLIQRRAWR